MELLWIVAAAILLWLVVLVFNTRTITLNVPLTITGLEPNLAIANDLSTIRVSAQMKLASGRRIKAVNSIDANLDFSEVATVGKYQLQPNITTSLAEIKIISFYPELFNIEVVSRSSRAVSLNPQTTGFVASGYSIKNITLSPDSVVVSGPEAFINTVTTAIVPIKLTGQTTSFVTTGEPAIINTAGQKLINLSFSPEQVTVSVEISPGSSFKTVGLKPIFSGTLPTGYWLSTLEFRPQALTIKGDGAKLSAIESLATTPINLSEHYSDFRDKVSVDLPEGVELLELNLIEVTVGIGTAVNTRELVLLPKYANVTAGFAVTLVAPATATVVISGPPEKLAKLSRANVALELDLRGTLSGLNRVDITKEMFKIPEGVTVVNFTPKTLEVTLTKSEPAQT